MLWNSVSWIDALGYAASLTVFATFCMGTMMPLRYTALASNVLFAAFGYFGGIYPVLILHALLFPVNLIRLVQIQRLVREVGSATSMDQFIGSLLPFMSVRRAKAGDVLARKGELADRVYYLVEGQLQLEELGKVIDRGSMIGEIGIFAPNQKRMATITCKTDCYYYEMRGSRVKELYFQQPAFAYAVLQMIVGRLLENLEDQKAAVSSGAGE
jgi:CRP/FNR family transcriptional regulator, cyclic AMP receptor protein